MLKNSAIFLLLFDQNWRKKNFSTLRKHLNFDEFEVALKSLKRNKSTGFDELSSNIIIDACDTFNNILFHVFKVSIQ